MTRISCDLCDTSVERVNAIGDVPLGWLPVGCLQPAKRHRAGFLTDPGLSHLCPQCVTAVEAALILRGRAP